MCCSFGKSIISNHICMQKHVKYDDQKNDLTAPKLLNVELVTPLRHLQRLLCKHQTNVIDSYEVSVLDN